jgi:TolB-like protein/Tfp pilus assembly protein PilF
LLGGFELWSGDGRDAAPPGRKVRALMTCLALSPGKPWPREKLMALLWGDRSGEQARASLRQALAEMRRVLGEPSPVRTEHDAISLDPALFTVDAVQFERLAKAGKLDEAAALYHGPLLDGHRVRDSAFEDWILVERTRLHDLAVDLLDRMAAAQSGDAAIATAQRLLQLDPAREETHRLLMRLYASIGQRAQALRQYEHCREILQRDLEAKPDNETERLYRQIQHEIHPPPAQLTDAAPTPASPLHDKPSIAVLPFHNLSGDPEQRYFSDGITEDIITELSRFHDLFVIARNSSFQYQGEAVDIRRVGRELGVHCVVEGSVRTLGDRIRITAQLIDASTGNHLWAERYDRDMQDIFGVQEDVARSVASTVGGRVAAAGRDRVLRLSVSALRAYDLVLRAKALILRYNKADNEQARLLAEKAVQLDPTNARAYTLLAWGHFYSYMAWWGASRGEALARAYEASQQSVMLDEADSCTRMHLGLIHLFRRQYDEAQSEIEKAVDLNPNDSEARGAYGIFLTCTGKPDAAIEQFDLATRHNPFDLSWTPWCKGIAYFTAHRYEEAITTLKRVRDPINEVRGWLAASYAHAGHLTEARATLEEFLRVAEHDMTLFPGRRVKDWKSYWHGAMEYRDETDFDHLFSALHKAGLSE